MVYVWFIDTNVLASWIIVESGLLKKLSEHYNYPFQYQELYSEKYRGEVAFINAVLNANPERFQKEHEMLVSFLATNELFSAIRDEVISLKLFHKGIPVSRWPGAKNRETLSEEESKLVYETTLAVWDKLFGGNVIVTNDDPFEGEAADTTNYWDIYAPILFKIKNTKTQDTMLLTTAIINDADYFVTRDDHLKEDVGDVLQKQYGLHIINPDTALLYIQRYLKTSCVN